MYNKVKAPIIVFIFVSIIISGCSSKGYDAFRSDFTKKYYEIAESINIKHTLESLKNLQSDKNKENIDKLKVALEDIKDKVQSGMKEDYEMLTEWYQGIVLLKDSYEKWDKLSSDEKGHILSELRQADLRKRDKDN